MYLPDEQKEIIAEDLAELFHKENLLVAFVKRSADLYETYDEFTADDIMRLVKKKFLLKHLNDSSLLN